MFGLVSKKDLEFRSANDFIALNKKIVELKDSFNEKIKILCKCEHGFQYEELPIGVFFTEHCKELLTKNGYEIED